MVLLTPLRQMELPLGAFFCWVTNPSRPDKLIAWRQGRIVHRHGLPSP